MGGFASAFDLISSEYGWTDEYIFNLSLSRMLQIVAAIGVRGMREKREERVHLSWMTRTLATFIAAGYQTEDTKGTDLAMKITIDDIERQINEADLPMPVIEPQKGSSEHLMRLFKVQPGH